MIKWADRWQAGGCVDLCLIKLAELDIPALKVQDANDTLFALPQSVRGAAAFAGLQAKCEEWLVGQFGDVYEIITNAELLQSFCTLSFFAVHMWAALDVLAVHTENDVAVLLALWHYGEVGKQCSEDDVLQLGHLLRLGCLTPIYRRLMLPELAWFEGHVTRMHVFAAMWEHGSASTIPCALTGLEFYHLPLLIVELSLCLRRRQN